MLAGLLRTLDLRFAEPEAEALYYNYYAQVKRTLLPTGHLVVLLVNLLQTFATCLHLWEPIRQASMDQQQQQQASDSLSLTPMLWCSLILQALLFVATFGLRKWPPASAHSSDSSSSGRSGSATNRATGFGDGAGGSSEPGEQTALRDSEPDQQSAAGQTARLSSSLSLTIETVVTDKLGGASPITRLEQSSSSKQLQHQEGQREEEEEDNESERKLSHPVSSRSSNNRRLSSRLSSGGRAVPYLLWAIQLLQLSSGLYAQNSFVTYSTMLVYTYTIYKIFPIRLMNCILLALGMASSQILLDHLLLSHLRSSAQASDILAPDSTIFLIPLTSHSSKLVGFLILVLSINCIGIMSFFFYERQQRCAFLETRQSLETKLILEQESQEQERLLLSILPVHLAAEIRQDLGAVVTGQFKKIYMSRHENVSILFADIVGFTAISSNCQAAELVKTLNELFARFDKLAEKYHQLRIKILGDCYYAISGAPQERPDHAVLCVHMGLSMVEAIKSVREKTKSTVDMRVGVHTGAVLAGVLGQRQWQFDVYSKDVELANKMESSGLPGRVHISNVTLRFLNDEFELSRGDGESREDALKSANIQTYFIDRVKRPYPEGTLDAANLALPNSNSTCAPGSAASLRPVNNSSSSNNNSPPGYWGPRGKATVAVNKKQAADDSSTTGSNKQASSTQDKNSSPSLEKQIKRASLKFTNAQLESQFRSTSDIASCISLIGLPITLLSAASAHLYLYKFLAQVTLPYWLTSLALLLVVLLCILPYLWLQSVSPTTAATRQHHQTIKLSGNTSAANDTNSSADARIQVFEMERGVEADARAGGNRCKGVSERVLALAMAVKQRAWMKLTLTATLTLAWLMTHAAAVHGTAINLSWLVRPHSLALFTGDLFNYCAIACSLAITALTRISFLLKTGLILFVISFQVILNSGPLAQVLSWRSSSFSSTSTAPSPSSPSSSSSLVEQYLFSVTLFTICWCLFLINRQSELTNRRLFLWRKQVEQQKEKVADMREKNEALVYNILPPNVAKIFLGKRIFKDGELYSKSYDAVGVLFAAMPNFSDFYSEESVNNQGLECLRFLNEVISDYDALLDDERFRNIVKIKTMGSTYMAASGLYEDDAREQVKGGPAAPQLDHSAKWGHLEQLTEFALALKETLSNINKESFNNFVLRVGINHGPITAGVIGVKKPHFDMWGNTVNVASRMETTGRAGSIQVVEETANILATFGFQFTKRGLVPVKGKGKLMTFYLSGKK